jgi:hypothetical protein
MKWSTARPTEPGYYWWQDNPNARPEIVKLRLDLEEFAVWRSFAGYDYHARSTTHGRWGDRIPAPDGGEPWEHDLDIATRGEP